MLSGRSVDAADAQQIGLVDAVTAQRHLYTAAVNGVLKGLQTNRSSTPLLYNIAPVRIALAWLMRRKTQQKVSSPASYPAPFALIDLWRKHGGSREQLSRAEARSLAELMRGTAA
jgi:3-hydroxyacyl-CoA dehydrogenase/enoyl-CoA hydratase/3-hydroxybutyryl-CoA epimerase